MKLFAWISESSVGTHVAHCEDEPSLKANPMHPARATQDREHPCKLCLLKETDSFFLDRSCLPQ